MLSLGVFSVAWWPWLPSFGVSFGLFITLLSVCVFFRLKRLLWLIALSAGMLWGIFCGHQLLRETLPEKYSGKEFLVTGQIVSLVDSNAIRSRFAFAAEAIQVIGDPHANVISGKLLLSWYAAEELYPGQRWQLVVRLRPPEGLSILEPLIIRAGYYSRAIAPLVMCALPSLPSSCLGSDYLVPVT